MFDTIDDASSIIAARPDNLLVHQEILLDPNGLKLPVAGHTDGLSDGSFLNGTPAETKDRHVEQVALTVFFEGQQAVEIGQARQRRCGHVCRRLTRG